MSSLSLFRHLAILIILSSIFIQEVGWQNSLIWFRLNQKVLLLWIFVLFILILVNYFVFRKTNLTNKKWPELLKIWFHCPKCRAFWFGALVSALYHAVLWDYWLTWLFFALWGASFCSFFTIFIYQIFKKEMAKS